VVIAGFALGLSVLRVESDVILYFPRGTEVRDSYEAIRERLAGISPMNVVIESSAGRSVTEPDVLRAVAGLQEFLQTVPDVGKVVSLAVPLIQVHTGFAGTTTSVLPDSRELAEQYLLLLESFDQIRDLVSSDRRMTNVLIRSNHNGSEHLLALAERAAGWWRMHGAEDFSARTTGIMFEFARSEHELGVGQIQGLGLDVATVAMLLLVLFESSYCRARLIPNLVPLVLVFGFMGLAGIPLDIGTVLVETSPWESRSTRRSTSSMPSGAAWRGERRRVRRCGRPWLACCPRSSIRR
jgi:predicted RND superfamily exporter protein